MLDLYEIIGYSGSILVAVSLMMKNILKLRVINFFGASSFALYGYLVDAYPVLILNSFIVVCPSENSYQNVKGFLRGCILTNPIAFENG